MKVDVEISERELRYLVMNYLNQKLGGVDGINVGNIHNMDVEVKMTYGEKENWRRPKYLRVTLSKEVPQ